ncbi:MAG: hypothetical protein HY721_02315 [Planctomycetes bacterium]|nr:hypothetical protein [Planctomycetota bacterium]
MTWQGATYHPTLGSCAFEVVAGDADFLRGDSTGDGRVDISDPIHILGCKFLGAACPTCSDASDANDDGLSDVSDPIFLLSFLFLGGPPPRPPGLAECGPDPTVDSLPTCDYSSCPP